MDGTLGHRWLLCGLLALPGVSALEVGVDGIIGSTIAAGLMLVAIVIVSAILCYKYSAPREPPKPRYRKPLPKPKYDMNGNAPNGIPMQTMVPNGIMGTPHGTQRSTRSKHIGSHRGAPGPLRFSVAPPGLYRSMMAPYFMQPPYQQIIYIDESDDDENSVRSTMREHKKRYRRSYFSTSKDPSSKIEIKKRSRRPHPKLRDFVRSNPPGEDEKADLVIEEKSSHSSSSISSKSSNSSDRGGREQTHVSCISRTSSSSTASSVAWSVRDHSRKEKCKPRISNGEIKRDPEHRSRSSSNASYPRPQWEVESTEEQIKFSDEEAGKKSPKRNRRSKSPEKHSSPRPRSQSPENAVPLRKSTKLDTSTRMSNTSNDVRQIDDIFSGVHAEPTAGDIIYREPEDSPKQTTPRKPFREEERKEVEEPSTNEYAMVIKPSQRLRESTRSSEGEDGSMYAAVIKQSTSVGYNGNRDNPLRQSMSNQLEDIIQSRHDGKPTEFDRSYNEDEEDETEVKEIPQYPRKTYSLSQSERRDISSQKDRLGFSPLSKTTRPYRSEQDDYTFDRDYPREDRPVTPPVDIPSEPVSPRESFNRPDRSSMYPKRPETPPFDAVETPRVSTTQRPPTPPFDAETDRSIKEKKFPLPPPTESRGPPDIKTAFSNQVLRELQQRHRGASIDADDDDDDASNSRAVNFSAAPPEIIPRSEPNSPRTSINIPQTGGPPPRHHRPLPTPASPSSNALEILRGYGMKDLEYE